MGPDYVTDFCVEVWEVLKHLFLLGLGIVLRGFLGGYLVIEER